MSTTNTPTPATDGAGQLDTRTLAKSLQGTTCPACRQGKVPHQTFCRRCYRKLTREQQFALYKRIGQGYAEAVADAVKTLGVEFFVPGAQ